MNEFDSEHPRGRHEPAAKRDHEHSTTRLSSTDAGFDTIIESAARLHEVVPDAVLVGGTAAAYYAGHRVSFDHDHVIEDLQGRYQQVLDAVEATMVGRLRPV